MYFVNLWKNIWSELNKTRPCLVYSIKNANFWNTVVILPFKSFKWSKITNFQIEVDKSNENYLEKKSIVDITSIRQISKKRFLTKKWKLEKKYINDIDEKILSLFWIKK